MELEAVALLVVSLFFTLMYEATKIRWMSVFVWMLWWILALAWVKFNPESWPFSLVAFGVGAIYFVRVIMEAIGPSRVKKVFSKVW